MLKRHYFAGPFDKCFGSVGQRPTVIKIDNRMDESVFFTTVGDRVMVIFSINFSDKDDIVYGKVFLQVC